MKKLILWINIIGMIILSSILFSCKKDSLENEFDISDLDQYYIVGILDFNQNEKGLYTIYFSKEGKTIYANHINRGSINKVPIERNNETLSINIDPYKEQTFNYTLKKQEGKYILKYIGGVAGAYGEITKGSAYLYRKDNSIEYKRKTYESFDPTNTYVKFDNYKWGISMYKNSNPLNKIYISVNNYIWQGENYFGVLVPNWENINHPIMLMEGPNYTILKLKEM